MDPRVAPSPLFSSAGMSWFGLVAAPAAWSVNHVLGYALASWTCGRGSAVVLPLLTCCSLALAVAGAWQAGRDARRLHGASLTNAAADGRARFAALAGAGLAVLFTLVLVLDVLAELLLGPCRR